MNQKLVFGIIGGIVGLGLIVAIAVSVATGGVDPEAAFGEVTVEGTPLPVFADDPANDVAIGMTAPTVSGTDFDGSEVTIGPDGRAKVVLFLAHWCPHCQAEVPRVVEWLEAGNKPENVDFYAISTLVNRVSGNWPPQQWLEREGLDLPLIQDDTGSNASEAFGMAGTPFWMALDGENNVIVRVGGEIGQEGFTSLFATASQNT
jgi:cytochrome c biogenesis protein CcmG/thiol:disulfide interchange protein DsbE